MPRTSARNKILTRISFTHGVKRSLNPLVVPENAVWDARNIRADESGVLRICEGFNSFIQSLGTGPVQFATDAFGDIIMAWNRNLYRVNSSGELTVLAEGMIGSESYMVEPIKWARGGNEIVYIFAGNGLLETDGNSVSLVTPYAPETGEQPNLLRDDIGNQDTNSGPAKCRLAILRASLGQRIVAAGDPDSPNTVYLSAPLDATYWPADQIIQLPDDGDRIIALANWYGAVIIFREHDIWAFFGTDATDSNAVLVLQKTGVGCIASRTVCDVPGVGLVFLGTDNVYALNNVTAMERMATVKSIGDDISYYLTPFLADSKITWACAIYNEQEYRLCIPFAPIPVFRFLLRNTAGWYIDSAPRVTQFFIHNNVLFAAAWERGQLYRFNNTLMYDGMPINYYVAFRREQLLPGPSRIKKLYIYALAKGRHEQIEQYFWGQSFNSNVFGESQKDIVEAILGSEQHLNISLLVDGNEFTVNNVSVTVERKEGISLIDVEDMEPVQVYYVVFHPSIKGHFVQLRISAGQPGEDIALLGYSIEYEPSRVMSGKQREV
ncbi:MAG: hypothetical protein PWR14_983 [Thermosediminibacterales bacterium]|nr:hypothetical protein [Thermosediminibacterales bacterium]